MNFTSLLQPLPQQWEEKKKGRLTLLSISAFSGKIHDLHTSSKHNGIPAQVEFTKANSNPTQDFRLQKCGPPALISASHISAFFPLAYAQTDADSSKSELRNKHHLNLGYQMYRPMRQQERPGGVGTAPVSKRRLVILPYHSRKIEPEMRAPGMFPAVTMK